VTDIAVGGGDQLDVMSQTGPLHGDAAGAVFGIVGVCAEDDNAELSVSGRLSLGGRGRGRRSGCMVEAVDEQAGSEPQGGSRSQCQD